MTQTKKPDFNNLRTLSEINNKILTRMNREVEEMRLDLEGISKNVRNLLRAIESEKEQPKQTAKVTAEKTENKAETLAKQNQKIL